MALPTALANASADSDTLSVIDPPANASAIALADNPPMPMLMSTEPVATDSADPAKACVDDRPPLPVTTTGAVPLNANVLKSAPDADAVDLASALRPLALPASRLADANACAIALPDSASDRLTFPAAVACAAALADSDDVSLSDPLAETEPCALPAALIALLNAPDENDSTNPSPANVVVIVATPLATLIDAALPAAPTV